MVKKDSSTPVWYVYVFLCENRKIFSAVANNVGHALHEQLLAKSKTLRFLSKNRPILLIKKYKFKSEKAAQNRENFINSLKGSDRDEIILQFLLKKRKPDRVEFISKGKYEICCSDCGFKTNIACEEAELDKQFFLYKCVHETIKDKIDMLFEQAVLGAACFINGKFIFEGKRHDRARDYLFGFNDERQHRKRTMGAYELLDEIAFKNSYLLLSSIMEESYFLIKEYAEKYTSHKFKSDYKYFSFQKNENDILMNSKQIRYHKVAHFVRLTANILKHSAGKVQGDQSGKQLMKYYGFKQGDDLIAYRKIFKINSTYIGDIMQIILCLYVFIVDLISEIFKFKKFKIAHSRFSKVMDSIINCDTREAYLRYLKDVQQDGSVMFVNL
jgi:predicted GIY-YIG superfamily endonuclease